MEEESDKEENEDEELNEDEPKMEVIQSKDLTVEIRIDPSSGKRKIDSNLLDFMRTILANPIDHRAALSKVVSLAIDCFIACVARLGTRPSLEKARLRFTGHSDNG